MTGWQVVMTARKQLKNKWYYLESADRNSNDSDTDIKFEW